MISLEKLRHSEHLNSCSYVQLFNCSSDDDPAASSIKYITLLIIFMFLLSMSIIEIFSLHLFGSIPALCSMLLFGVLQHRKYIQNLSEGYVYIFLHSMSATVTPSCSTPLTPLKFKSETSLYSPNHNQFPNHPSQIPHSV